MEWTTQVDTIGFVGLARKYVQEAKRQFGRVYLLDIGFGQADYILGTNGFPSFAENSDYTIGIEPSEGRFFGGNLEKAVENWRKSGKKNTLLIQARGQSIPVRDSSVHIVTNKESSQDPEILRETYRVLVPGGYYIKSGSCTWREATELGLELLQQNKTFAEKYGKNGRRWKRNSQGLEGYEREVAKAGFEVLPGDGESFPRQEERTEYISREDVIKKLQYPGIFGGTFASDSPEGREFLELLGQRHASESGCKGTRLGILLVAQKA